MIALIALSAFAADRETSLDRAAEYTTHEWSMTSVNETASCSTDYVSDYTAGTWHGLPYDWGGYYEIAEYDQAIADGLGAGSHSWHGILSCTAGVDCSGFVSKVWETGHYSTSTFYQTVTEIGADELLPADAVNDAGSHVVLYTYETGAGAPVFYEASGSASHVRMNNFSGWSYLDGYQPIRFDGMADADYGGTVEAPHEITAFPFEDLRWTAGAPSDAIDAYSCAPTTDESGPEVLYHFQTRGGGSVHAVVSDEEGIDIDVHVLAGVADGDHCLARNDVEVTVDVPPGDVWIAMDTYVGGHEFPGPFLLDVTFDGELGAPDPVDTGSPPDPDDTGSPDLPGGDAGGWGRHRFAPGGCDNAGGASMLAVGAALLLIRRRRDDRA